MRDSASGQFRGALGRSAFDWVIARRPPAENQVPLLRASASLASSRIMGMHMRRAICHGVFQCYVTLKALVQISSLSDVDGNPTTVLGLFGVNVIACLRLEHGVNGTNLVLILIAGLPGPSEDGRRLCRLWVTAE